MTDVVHVPSDNKITSKHDVKAEFKNDIRTGFSQQHKSIQSKYFYDAEGSTLFNKITRHPDYYLTDCEIEILKTYKQQLSDFLGKEAFNLIELGPGEGIKTKLLIEQFLQDRKNFIYMPIDISTNYLENMIGEFEQGLPHLKLTPIHSDYFRGLEWLSHNSVKKNLVLFLGSSIGNFNPKETDSFLSHLQEVLHDGDYVLLGFDLRKDIPVLMRAYDDNSGITRDFNLNLLKRINRELNANFAIDKFHHYATYNVYTGAMESYLISLEKQLVYIDALQQSYLFDAIEPIHVEYSYKYLLSQVEALAAKNGFKLVKHFVDSREYFVDSLWQVVKSDK